MIERFRDWWFRRKSIRQAIRARRSNIIMAQINIANFRDTLAFAHRDNDGGDLDAWITQVEKRLAGEQVLLKQERTVLEALENRRKERG